jgi:glycosyltransferase involved in cell wall biosynthesis
MTKLLCITDNPDDPCGDAQILHHLLPVWQNAFEAIDIWVPPKAGDPDRVERYDKLGDELLKGRWTHVWVYATLAYLDRLVNVGVRTNRLPNVILYAYANVDTPFVDSRYAFIPEHFDFFVVPFPMAGSAMKQTLLRPGITIPKETFKAIKNMVAIPIGIDTKTFRPLNVHKRQFSREEIRETMFGDKVKSDDLLILVGGRPTKRKGIPQALSIIRSLKNKYPDRRVRGYFHMPMKVDGIDLPTLVAGNELALGEDVLFGNKYFNGSVKLDKEKLNYVYNAADMMLCTDVLGGWPFMAVEAMAAGTLVAGPDDFVWLDVIGDEKGIMLPTTEFSWAPWNTTEYVRTVNSGDAATAIADALSTNNYKQLRENGIAWAHKSEINNWAHNAGMWLRLFGLR